VDLIKLSGNEAMSMAGLNSHCVWIVTRFCELRAGAALVIFRSSGLLKANNYTRQARHALHRL